MALTRKMLSAMEIPAEKIDEIINAHTETVNALKEERDKAQKEYEELKEQAKDANKLSKELESVQAELEKIKGEDWEKKYKDTKSEYDAFKADTDAKETRAKKESAYKKLLEKAGVSAKRIDSIIKVSASVIDSIKFDKDGNVEEADKIVESVKTEWADFISTTHEQGANVAKPASNNGGEVKKPSKAAEMVAQYRNEHYGNPTKED